MKTINKALLDELIRITRKYWKTGDEDMFPAKHGVAMKLSKDTFGDEHHWCACCDIVSAILGGNGLDPRAGNEKIHRVFEAAGYEVVEPGRGEA